MHAGSDTLRARFRRDSTAGGTPERAAGITTLTLWGGFASTVFIPLIQLLIDIYGWRGALLGMAAVNGIVCGGLYLIAIDPSKDSPARIAHPDEVAPLAGKHAAAAAMRKPSYWGLMLAWVSYAAAFSSLTYHFYPLLLERGLDAAGVVTVMAVIGPAQVIGRIAIMAFAPRAPVKAIGSAVVIVFPLAVIGLSFAPPEVSAIAAIAAFYGAANGMITIVRGIAVPEMVTRQAYGAVNGSLVAPMNLMQAAAPLAAAVIWQPAAATMPSWWPFLRVLSPCVLASGLQPEKADRRVIERSIASTSGSPLFGRLRRTWKQERTPLHREPNPDSVGP
ncbi:MFS transporter [Pseudaminobacter sp. NGMCC 1.201702]|uniref:MFS transporter n=1 Tax=Pseudaminobacter sp. NGMCC 1.201702 TaxID=3391825 RepID=UPI0039F0B55C